MTIVMVILPVFGIYALGYGGYHWLKPDIPNLARVAVYLMLPLLCFETFYRHELSFGDVSLILYTVVLTYILIGLIYGISRLLGYDQRHNCSLILSSVFMNSGNYGIPIILLAFGEAGRPTIIFLTVLHGVLQGTIGIYYAAKGGSEKKIGIKEPLLAVLKMPVIHAILAGMLLQKLNVHIPDNLMVCIAMVGNASIPTVMLVLGMQLATISIVQLDWLRVSLSVILKLFISPLIAYFLCFLMPISPLVKQIFIITAGMPTAAGTTMLAIQFNADPKFVSGVTFVSTLLSIPTIAVLLYLVEIGAIFG